MQNTTTRNLDAELNQMILQGAILDAFDKFYSDDVAMQEGVSEPRSGKRANREYEEQFVGAIAEVHNVALLATAVEGDRSYSEWIFDITFKDGNRIKNTQTSARTWRDGKVVFERFYVAAA